MLKKLVLKNKIFSIVVILSFTALPVAAISPVISWMMDMYDQPSVKPQEGDSMTRFPKDSVTTDGIVIRSDGLTNPYATDPTWQLTRNDAALALKNPVPKTDASVKNGEYLFNVYCVACHGPEGRSDTPVAKKRFDVPPLADIIQYDPTLTDGYLFNKIQYGNVIMELMPPFGYATTPKERWDIVNYLKTRWKPENL